MSTPQSQHVLYIVTCATLAARDIGKLVGLAQDDGWKVCVVATPMATRFIDRPALVAQTGYPVRSDDEEPGRPDILPPATAMIVGGASANTINKLAAGISDNLALGLLNETIGLGLPLVILPFVNTALAAHPAFSRSVRELRDAGVDVLLGDDGFVPNPPGEGERNLRDYPWMSALRAVEKRVQHNRADQPAAGSCGLTAWSLCERPPHMVNAVIMANT